MLNNKIRRFLCGALLALPFVSAHASIITLDTSQSEFDRGVLNQGWWASSSNNMTENDNHITGTIGYNEYRSFYTFDVSSIKGKVKSASLGIKTGSQTGPVSLYLYDVSTPAALVNANTGLNTAIFDDLGSGEVFAKYLVFPGFAESKYLWYTMYSDVFDNIENAKDYFTIGVIANPANGNYIFGSTGSDPSYLLLDVDDGSASNRVPEPASLAILIAGLGGMAFARRRK